jgi:broad specificity phosphatase PhoE
MPRKIFFISHPDVDINPEIPVTRWGLSATGREKSIQLQHKPWIKTLSAIWCSSEQKSIECAQILSAYTDVGVTQLAALGENDRSSTGYLPGPEFEAVADQFFAQPEVSVRGWETAVAAQQRIVKAVSLIDTKAKGTEPLAIVSHGAVGTLLYCYLNNLDISRRWDQPGSGGGNYMVIDAGTSCSWWQPID